MITGERALLLCYTIKYNSIDYLLLRRTPWQDTPCLNRGMHLVVSSAQRIGFFNIGSGRVLDKIPGSGSGSGRVGVSKNMIGYFRVSCFLSGISGISGYVGYFRVFLGLPIYTRVIF